MARLVTNEQVTILQPWQQWLRTVFIGAGLGVLFWVLTALLSRYVIEPITCQQIVDVAACVDATSRAGMIAAILTGFVAVLVMVRMRIAQPIILAVGTAAILWDLAAWTTGLLWIEAIAWSILLYALCYGLFGWITRVPRLIIAIIIGLIICLSIRIILVLS